MVTAELLESQPDCFMVALRVQHSDSEKCSQKLKQLKTFLTGFDGFSNLSVIRRDGGLGTDFYIIVRFDSIDALQAWRSAPETVAMAKEIEAMAITDISRQHASGASIWFEPVSSMPSTPKPPLFWKRWVTSMLAVSTAV